MADGQDGKEREAAVADALLLVEKKLAAITYRWFGGLPFIEREQAFIAGHTTAKAIFGDRWNEVMRAAFDRTKANSQAPVASTTPPEAALLLPNEGS